MKAMLAASVAAFTLLAMPLIGVATAEAQSQSAEPGPVATTALVREIQFMLLTIGIDPGPIDGNPRQLTNRAVHIFQQRSGLPKPIWSATDRSPAFLERLRGEAAQVMLKPAPSSSASPPQAIVAQPPPPTPSSAPSPDRFASCTYNAADFRVGGRQARRNRSLTRASTAPQIGR